MIIHMDCPDCSHTELDIDEPAQRITCPSCKFNWPVSQYIIDDLRSQLIG